MVIAVALAVATVTTEARRVSRSLIFAVPVRVMVPGVQGFVPPPGFCPRLMNPVPACVIQCTEFEKTFWNQIDVSASAFATTQSDRPSS